MYPHSRLEVRWRKPKSRLGLRRSHRCPRGRNRTAVCSPNSVEAEVMGLMLEALRQIEAHQHVPLPPETDREGQTARDEADTAAMLFAGEDEMFSRRRHGDDTAPLADVPSAAKRINLGREQYSEECQPITGELPEVLSGPWTAASADADQELAIDEGQSPPPSSFIIPPLSVEYFAFPALPPTPVAVPLADVPSAAKHVEPLSKDSASSKTPPDLPSRQVIPLAEPPYEALAGNILAQLEQLPANARAAVLFTSPGDGDGKTRLIDALAPVLAALANRSVLAAEADLRTLAPESLAKQIAGLKRRSPLVVLDAPRYPTPAWRSWGPNATASTSSFASATPCAGPSASPPARSNRAAADCWAAS